MRHTRAWRQSAKPLASRRTAAIFAASFRHFTDAKSTLNPTAVTKNSTSQGLSGLLRRTTATHPEYFSDASHSAQNSAALRCSRATIKSRSLAPDDPFGEKSSWEDPSDGLFSAWKDVDQEGFVNATQSAEVRNAHFGPEWARFTTVGRMSVKKMKEEQAVQEHPPAPSSAGSDADATSSTSTAATPPPKKQYPSAEEMHEAELKAKRRLLQRNYTSYEAFVEHELGAGEGFSDEATASGGYGDAESYGKGAELYSAASMERAFAAVEGVDGRDRMAQRNVEREALDTMEAAEVEETVPLPNFILEPDAPVGSLATPPVDGQMGSTFNAEEQGEENPPRSESTQERARGPQQQKQASPPHDELPASGAFSTTSPAAAAATAIARPSHAAAAASTTIPTAVVHQVLAALGSPHGDQRIPLTDPMHWATEDIIHFLTVMEQPPADAEAAARETWSTMDDTMSDTFRMAKVTGDTLLNVVVPPRLFRLMRRWHVRRQDVVNKAWKLHQESRRRGGDTVSSVSNSESAELTETLPEDVVTAAVEQNRAKLDEAVQPLDRILIQETILLCFPYGH